MDKKVLKTILEKHNKWLDEDETGERADLHGANLSDANLSDANLSYADLHGANIDFSCLPLWCGSLKAHFDDKQVIQIFYHILSVVSYSRNVSEDIKKLLLTPGFCKFANKFHRVDECGYLDPLNDKKSSELPEQ